MCEKVYKSGLPAKLLLYDTCLHLSAVLVLEHNLHARCRFNKGAYDTCTDPEHRCMDEQKTRRSKLLHNSFPLRPWVFPEYLHNYRHTSSPDCPACVSIVESAEHVLFHCPRFAEERHEITVKCGTTINGTNLTEVMLKNAETWKVVANGMRSILLMLQASWKEDQRLGRA